jgi:hypothetical protein
MLKWYIAQVATLTERKAVKSLRELGFNTYLPCLREWKSVPKGPREKEERPLFPGYLFIGVGPGARFDKIHEARVPVHIVPNGWPAEAFADMVNDLAFRQLAGEFDKTGTETYLPKKPITGPLTRTLGKGMTCLSALLKRDANGRLDLLLSGELIEGGEPIGEEAANDVGPGERAVA